MKKREKKFIVINGQIFPYSPISSSVGEFNCKKFPIGMFQGMIYKVATQKLESWLKMMEKNFKPCWYNCQKSQECPFIKGLF